MLVGLETDELFPHRGCAEANRLLCCLQGGWQNRILARLANEMSRYNPIHYVPQVKARVLMVATTEDALCSINVARRAASLNPLVRLVEKDAGERLSLVPTCCNKLTYMTQPVSHLLQTMPEATYC
jgi:hypothetical protein